MATLTLALAAAGAPQAWAQDVESKGIVLRTAPALEDQARSDAERKLPIILRAQEIRGRPDLETLAEGDAELRRGGLLIRADRTELRHRRRSGSGQGQGAGPARWQRLQRA